MAITWNGATDNWGLGTNWVGNAVPGTGDDVVFDGTSNYACLLDTHRAAKSLTVTSDHSGDIDLVSSNLTLDTGGDVTLAGGGTFDMGNGTMSLDGGDFNSASQYAFSRGASHLSMAGIGTITHNHTLRFFEVESGATITWAGDADIFGTVTLDGSLSINSGAEIYHTVGCILDVNDGGALIGDGTYTFNEPGAGEGVRTYHAGGTIDVANLVFKNPASSTTQLDPGTYGCDLVRIYNSTAADKRLTFQAGTYVFEGNLEFENSSTSDLLIKMSASGSDITVEGNLIVDNVDALGHVDINNSAGATNWTFEGDVIDQIAAGDLNWTNGSGITAFEGLADQTIDFHGKTIGATAITKASGDIDFVSGSFTSAQASQTCTDFTVSNDASFDLDNDTLTLADGGNFVSSTSGTFDMGTGELVITDGNFTVSAGTFTVATGTITLSAGTHTNNVKFSNAVASAIVVDLAASTHTFSGDFELENKSTGSLTLDNAADPTITIAGDLILDNDDASGSITIDETATNVTWQLSGNVVDEVTLGTLNITQGGGYWQFASPNGDQTVNVNSADQVAVRIAKYGTGDLDLASGSFISAYTVQACTDFTVSGTASFDLDDDTLTLTDGGSFVSSTSGTFDMGSGELVITDGDLTVSAGTFTVATGTITLSAGTHTNNVKCSNAVASAIVVSPAASTHTFAGDFELENTNAGGTLTLDNSANDPNFSVVGDIIWDEQAGNIAWTAGTGTLTASGGIAQSWDLAGETVEAIVVNKSADTLTFDGNVSCDSFTGTAGGIDFNGKTITATGAVTLSAACDLESLNGTVFTCGSFSASGSAGDPLSLPATANWTVQTIGSCTANYVDINYCSAVEAAGVASNSTGANCTNWTITPPAPATESNNLNQETAIADGVLPVISNVIFDVI